MKINPIAMQKVQSLVEVRDEYLAMAIDPAQGELINEVYTILAIAVNEKIMIHKIQDLYFSEN